MTRLAAVMMIVALAAPARGADVVKPKKPAEKWIPMFNGKDLTGWTPKFTGSPAGENLLNTFRVEDGVLTVSYADWANRRSTKTIVSRVKPAWSKTAPLKPPGRSASKCCG